MNEATQQAAIVKTLALAIWSLVLGILGLCLFCPLTAIPAVICGHLAISQISRASGRLAGHGLAIAGLVTGYVGIVLQLLIVPALLLPAVATARDRARRTACMSNLRQIGLAARMYSADNNEALPPSLSSLVPNYLTSMGLFICPTKRRQPGDASKIDEWSDYVLVPNRKESDPSDAVLAFSKPDCYPNKGGNVLFVDGHIEWCPVDKYNRLTANLGP